MKDLRPGIGRFNKTMKLRTGLVAMFAALWLALPAAAGVVYEVQYFREATGKPNIVDDFSFSFWAPDLVANLPGYNSDPGAAFELVAFQYLTPPGLSDEQMGGAFTHGYVRSHHTGPIWSFGNSNDGIEALVIDGPAFFMRYRTVVSPTVDDYGVISGSTGTEYPPGSNFHQLHIEGTGRVIVSAAAVPEPALAAPVAGLLGLAFFLMRRRG